MSQVIGFLCEVDATKCKVFDIIHHQLVELPNSDNYTEADLGKYLNTSGNSKFSVSVEGKDVLVRTLAMRPNTMAFSVGMKRKYENTVWSPILKYIDDPDDIVGPNFDEPLKITAKYAPSDAPSQFQVVSVEPPTHDVDLTEFADAPWSMELQIGRTQLQEFIDNAYKTSLFFGVCIASQWPNPYHNPINLGSPSHVSIFFSPSLGIARYINPIEVGQWGYFNVAKKKENLKSFTGAYNVVKFVECASPVTILKEGPDFEMKTYFTLNRPHLENTGTENHAYFIDPSLGKVKIGPRLVNFILEQTENVQESPITIGAKVGLSKSWQQRGRMSTTEQVYTKFQSFKRDPSVFSMLYVLSIHVAGNAIIDI